MSGRDDGLAAIEPLGRTRLVEGCGLGVKLHVTGVDARAVDPGVVQVALASFDEKNLEVVVEVGKSVGISPVPVYKSNVQEDSPSGNDTATRATSADNNVKLLREGAVVLGKIDSHDCEVSAGRGQG